MSQPYLDHASDWLREYVSFLVVIVLWVQPVMEMIEFVMSSGSNT